nr:MAG TPA: hypothetical protein [Caudoviricetes sp.]
MSPYSSAYIFTYVFTFRYRTLVGILYSTLFQKKSIGSIPMLYGD